MGLFGNIMGFLEEPVPSFYFEVEVQERLDSASGIASTVMGAVSSLILGDSAPSSNANSYQSVEGLGISFSTGTINEAGWSSPRPTFDKMNNDELTLVRYLRPKHMGIMGFSLDPMSDWCKKTMDSAKRWHESIETKDVMIYIYHPAIKNPLPVGPSSFPVAGFLAQEAYPIKWAISGLDSMNESEPIKETIVLRYTEMQRLEVPMT